MRDDIWLWVIEGIIDCELTKFELQIREIKLRVVEIRKYSSKKKKTKYLVTHRQYIFFLFGGAVSRSIRSAYFGYPKTLEARDSD